MGERYMYVLLLLLTVKAVQTYVIPSRQFTGLNHATAHTSQRNIRMHNSTQVCADFTVRRNTLVRCNRELLMMTPPGYPWFVRGNQTNAQNHQGTTESIDTLSDALDSLDHVCHILDRSKRCRKESGISDYCMYAMSLDHITLELDFQFICHQRHRDENLVHSLQCLHDKRVMVMLYFHIWNDCFRGMDILDDLMARQKKAYFYTLDVNPPGDIPTTLPLYCIPKSVISTCIRYVVQKHCGTMSADLVQDYLLYRQNSFDEAQRSAGLASDICRQDISHSIDRPRVPPISSHNAKLDFWGLLEMSAPGTALDTMRGRYILGVLQTFSGEELCDDLNVFIAYSACVMSSDAKVEKSRFNVLQYAHRIIGEWYHGAQCNRLEQFKACWQFLREICGSKVRGLEHHATLLMEGCHIQSEMDTSGCHWQDMLLRHYIRASHTTAWPLTVQSVSNPMSLESFVYTSTVTKDLDTVISLLQPGLEEISQKCGSQPAKRLASLLDQLRYLQCDALMYVVSANGNPNW